MEFRYFQDKETLVKNRCYLSWSVCVIVSPSSTLLQEDRRLSAPTINNLASSLLYPLKHYLGESVNARRPTSATQLAGLVGIPVVT